MTIQPNRHPDPDPFHQPAVGSGASLTLDHAGDALALVRHTFGELPCDSLVLIGIHQGTTGGHLRMDLAPTLQQPRRCAEKAAGWLAGPESDPVPDAVLAAVFIDHAPRPEQHQGSALLNELSEILQLQHQCPLIKTWYAGAGYVRDFDCTDPRCCPYPGLLIETELHAALARSPQLGRLERPTVPEQAIETFLGVPLAPSAPSPQEVSSLRAVRNIQPHQDANAALALWELSITEITTTGRSTSVQRPEHTAQLLHSAEDSLLVQSLAPLAAASLETARIWEPAPTEDRTKPANHQPQMLQQAHQDYVTVLTGQSGCSPDWARVEALDALLHLLAPYPGAQRRNLLALKGWIEWAKGRGSSAALAISSCLREEPNHQLATLLGELFDVSGPCQWARVKQLSHGWWRSQHPLQ